MEHHLWPGTQHVEWSKRDNFLHMLHKMSRTLEHTFTKGDRTADACVTKWTVNKPWTSKYNTTGPQSTCIWKWLATHTPWHYKTVPTTSGSHQHFCRQPGKRKKRKTALISTPLNLAIWHAVRWQQHKEYLQQHNLMETSEQLPLHSTHIELSEEWSKLTEGTNCSPPTT